MRAQVRPRRSQVPSPNAGMCAPFASMTVVGILVLRFPKSVIACGSFDTNFGIERALANYDARAAFEFEVPTRSGGKCDTNFKITALVSQPLYRLVFSKISRPINM